MKLDVPMPKMGESITEGRILTWLKKPGDTVERDEAILEISTDKVDTEVPSPAAGILLETLAAEGDTVEVGTIIATIETDPVQAASHTSTSPPASAHDTGRKSDGTGPRTSPAAAVPALETVAPPSAAPTAAETAPASTGRPDDRRFYSPVVMRLAAEHGVTTETLVSIRGTGANDRVTKADLLSFLERRSGGTGVPAVPAAAAPVAGADAREVEIVPMDNMRRLMAEHMVRSKQISPHVALVSDVDMTEVVRFRDAHAEAFLAREGIPLTFMPFIADAAVRALKEFPYVNASVEGTNILLKRSINLGIAVALDDGGLIVPVVKHADALHLTGLARAIADVARRARTRKLQPDEIQDGTFTITNFGVFGNAFGIPIINQPQVAILGVGALGKKPVVIERDGGDAIAIRSIVQLSLAFDHRIVDGALGGRFLDRIRALLETVRDTVV